MHLRKSVLLVGVLAIFYSAFGGLAWADETAVAAKAVNALGIDLLARVAKTDENALISPYSIQSALAMTYAGAAGETKAEMAKVLHFPADEATLHRSFAAFQKVLDEIHEATVNEVKESADRDGPSEPVTLEIANRLYGQSGYAFRPAFLSLVKDNYGAPFQPVDFRHAAERIRSEINSWVSARTHERINDLIPAGGVNDKTRLVLVNAIYFKAAWAEEFSQYGTKAEPFYIDGTKVEKVPTMQHSSRHYGYMRGDGFEAITLRYVGDDVQLLVLLPEEKEGLASLEAKLTPELLAECANPEPADLILHLPKFKLEPPTVPLGSVLRALGMLTAFDQPQGSTNFDRMAPRQPDDYLSLSDVFHKTFMAVDEQGTEATAATEVGLVTLGMSVQKPRPKPIEVKIDHPFLFAIQHRASGACLFLGRVVDPR